MQLYARVAWFNFGTYLAYPFELFASVAGPIIDLSLRMLFWSIVAASALGTINMRQILAYFLVATAIGNLTSMNGIKFGSWLARTVKYGDMNVDLVKPTNILHYYQAAMIGSSGVSYAASVSFLVIGLAIQPPVGLTAALLFVAYLPLAYAISYGVNVLVGTVAFYTTEAGSIKNVVEHIVSVFSGALIPLVFFPSALKTVVMILPFASAIYGPTQALKVTAMTSSSWLQLALAVFWAVVLVLAANKAWQAGMRRYEAIGI